MESPEPTGKAAHVDVVRRALELSRYARRLVSAEPHLLADNNASLPFTADAMRGVLETQAVGDDAALKRALRRLRKQVMLRVIVRDLGGLATLAEVIATTTALAEVAIGCALRYLSRWLAAQYGTPRGASDGKPQELHVVGMGKLGGGELNVSSDVDLVFVYPEDGETDGSRRISNHEFFTRLARQLIAALSELTADGYVFRVDMRLRPYGDSGPLAVSYEMLETYFITQGREWERYAWIKGRVVCRTDPDPLAALVRPFVYRRHLDFGAVASLRDLHRQIRREVERREMHDNVKLGPGGIREIEFIAQVFQLIRGGRDRALQCQPTLAVLPLLAERNLLPHAAVVELTEAYVFLRNLEHRLQYLDDQQTQDLPTSREDHALLAAAMGYATYDALLDALEAHRSRVTRHFEQVFAGPRREPEEHPLAALWLAAGGSGAVQLAEIGYADPERVLGRLAQLRAGSRYEQLSEASRARFDALVPQVIEIAAKFANPDATLERFLQLLEAISRRAAYLA
ncbi:MAG: bifunctional [glutamate--ammonia ligase]-adenylyl-L-tyrosine phosphorylase/[glutamate--ammonia-ligase] adenylyltransferase, partial [Betaproteobacteria bacterium]|nr:bifunctional [glutamate--ammonia ligase]-adenylyl-L-tyrosine phosphorylase/[glutamate--ammonia-ligase] adenylyltransferase [Betaproteobacteria bacterium]